MSTIQRVVSALYGWEDNRRSGVASAMRYRLCGISIYGLNGLMQENEHLAYTPVRSMAPCTFILTDF